MGQRPSHIHTYKRKYIDALDDERINRFNMILISSSLIHIHSIVLCANQLKHDVEQNSAFSRRDGVSLGELHCSEVIEDSLFD